MLLKILRQASPVRQLKGLHGPDLGVADSEPFPFLAIIGQQEMKLALLLGMINPRIGGVLLIGSRGTAKSTAVRSLIDLLPMTNRSLCPNGLGCTEEMIQDGDMTAVCQMCAQRFAYDEPLTRAERMRLVELPLNARLEDVVGGIDERVAIEQKRIRLERGILSQADNNLLYIDEVNLLDSAIMDAILDAAAQGAYTVRRGANKLTYRSKFVLVGSMNPEEGRLRPQIMDRFGLRVIVRGLNDPEDRFEAYERALWHRQSPEEMAAAYADETLSLAEEVQRAVEMLPTVGISQPARDLGLQLIKKAGIESNRAEITLFEAARAHAAAADRTEATSEDISAVAVLALRQRKSVELSAFFAEQAAEDENLRSLVENVRGAD